MRKVNPDPEKAKSLVKMSKKIKNRIDETNLEKYPSQVMKDYYEILKQLMEAIASLDGVKTKGKGAHKRLIDWIAKKYNLPERDRQFLQQIRVYRNRISYEGLSIDVWYLKRNKGKLERFIRKFREIVKKRLR